MIQGEGENIFLREMTLSSFVGDLSREKRAAPAAGVADGADEGER